MPSSSSLAAEEVQRGRHFKGHGILYTAGVFFGKRGAGDMGIMYGKGCRLALACDMLGERVGVSASVLSSALAPSKHVFLGRSA